MKTGLLACTAILCVVNPALAQMPSADVATELKAYYEKGTTPPWAEAIKNLTAEKSDQRTAAAKYLNALLTQVQSDEFSGKASWRATPYWGSRGENPALDLRKQIADELAKAKASPATLTVLRWYLDHEKVPRFQDVAVHVLDNVKGKEADEFCLTLLQPVHENSVVAVTALQQIGKRKSEIPDAVLNELCDHYRPGLRDAARKLNKERGGADPGPFDPGLAMKRPALAALMTSIGAVLDQPAAPTRNL